MSLITPHDKKKRTIKPGGARRDELNRIYAYPLPVLFSEPLNTRSRSLLGLLGLAYSKTISSLECEGVFDEATRSVWVTNQMHAQILWRRGFFGKGDLSRSEPTWLSREINAIKMKGKQLTSEEIREQRRAERKQFKLDRAHAMAVAAAEAEAAFAEGRIVSPLVNPDGTRAIPSAATWKPSPAPVTEVPPPPDDENDAAADSEALEDVEHLQLTLQEAFFLLWCLDSLIILDPHTREPLSLQAIWTTFQGVHHPPQIPRAPVDALPKRFDNPFLVHYAVYHHYRSLGWVVKGGIKFCVDYLLYKRGPVFSHAEFAIVVCPVYEDPADKTSSPFQLQNAEPFDWTWLSTINRVNSQVQKSLILTYITIPAQSRLPSSVLDTPACFAHYSVREVTLRRFIPARMRD